MIVKTVEPNFVNKPFLASIDSFDTTTVTFSDSRKKSIKAQVTLNFPKSGASHSKVLDLDKLYRL